MAGTVGDVVGTPFFCTAKIPRVDEAVRLFFFCQRDAFPVDNNLAIALLHPVPGNTPGSQLPHCLWCRIDEHPYHILVSPPIAAAHGI